MVTKTLPIRGMWAYEAQRECDKANLLVGAAVELRREPDNPHDPNAVAIVLRYTGSKLGYIPREIAKDLSKWLLKGEHYTARVCHLGTTTYRNKPQIGGDIEIDMASQEQEIPEGKPPVALQSPRPPASPQAASTPSRSQWAIPVWVWVLIGIFVLFALTRG